MTTKGMTITTEQYLSGRPEAVALSLARMDEAAKRRALVSDAMSHVKALKGVNPVVFGSDESLFAVLNGANKERLTTEGWKDAQFDMPTVFVYGASTGMSEEKLAAELELVGVEVTEVANIRQGSLLKVTVRQELPEVLHVNHGAPVRMRAWRDGEGKRAYVPVTSLTWKLGVLTEAEASKVVEELMGELGVEIEVGWVGGCRIAHALTVEVMTAIQARPARDGVLPIVMSQCRAYLLVVRNRKAKAAAAEVGRRAVLEVAREAEAKKVAVMAARMEAEEEEARARVNRQATPVLEGGESEEETGDEDDKTEKAETVEDEDEKMDKVEPAEEGEKPELAEEKFEKKEKKGKKRARKVRMLPKMMAKPMGGKPAGAVAVPALHAAPIVAPAAGPAPPPPALPPMVPVVAAIKP